MEGARITILRPLEPDGVDELDIVPSGKEYAAGQYLTWNLNNKKMWEDCYYRNPFSGKVEPAWTMHVEFVGLVVSDSTVEADRERIEKLEARFPKDRDLRETVM